MNIGLRIDVDTYRGTRLGVPTLCRILRERGIQATFFFSVGPDNMGRHLWRLARPTFLWKMLRTRAASLYGWDILLRGTFWPGPVIGRKLGDVIAAAAREGHEVGLHAWDHHAWQKHVEQMDRPALSAAILRGHDLLSEIINGPVSCSAVPGWRCTEAALLAKAEFPFQYNSDCRGHGIFNPVVDGQPLSQPQVPVTLPTYDEIIGRHGVTDKNYNEHLLSLLRPGALNVLTIHAEVEGMRYREMFERFLSMAQARGCALVPLGTLVESRRDLPEDRIMLKACPGREGLLACQASSA